MGRHHAGILGAGDVRVRNGAVAVTPARSAKCQAESGGFRDDARQSLAIEKRGRLLLICLEAIDWTLSASDTVPHSRGTTLRAASCTPQRIRT